MSTPAVENKVEYVENSVESVENAIFRLILEFFGETPPPRPAGPAPWKPRLFSAPSNKTADLENPVENLSKFSAPFPPHFPLPRPKSFAQKSSDGKRTNQENAASRRGKVWNFLQRNRPRQARQPILAA